MGAADPIANAALLARSGSLMVGCFVLRARVIGAAVGAVTSSDFPSARVWGIDVRELHQLHGSAVAVRLMTTSFLE